MTKTTRWSLTKFWRGYRFAAMTLLNTAAAIVVLNMALSVFFTLKDRYLSPDPVSQKYGQTAVKNAYEGRSQAEINALLRETWSRPYIYQPYTQFREAPHRGDYVNVSDSGFRITRGQGPWPPPLDALNVFVFGGSTTFGYGVGDDETIASHLQECLAKRLGRKVCVYNFGRGHYFSTQERILFEELLTAGFVPHAAVFIDGLNDFYYASNEPRYTSRLREFVAGGAKLGKFEGIFSRTALARALRALSGVRGKEGPGDEAAGVGTVESDIGDPDVIAAAIERYLANKRLIEAASVSFGFRPLFVWQPVPMYPAGKNDRALCRGFGRHGAACLGYERMHDRVAESSLGDNFLWGADIVADESRAWYVDGLHYSAYYSGKLAMHIADALIQRRIGEGPGASSTRM